MNRTPPRRFTVIRKALVTPHMLRITLGGAAMQTLAADHAGDYVKLVLGTTAGKRPLLRTYTIRAQRRDEIDIDFVLHAHAGPAAAWAVAAQPGDTIDIGAPGAVKRIDDNASNCLLVGDMTALPAISAQLERLPATARGQVLLEVTDADDIQTLIKPGSVGLHWLVNPDPGRNDTLLADALAALEWPSAMPAIWVACEFSGMRRIRAWLKAIRGVDIGAIYISSYWQRGSDELSHKNAKRADARQST